MLIRSISGIRGLVDKDLKNDSIIKYANALNEFFPEGVIYAGRDSRPSGEDIAQVMIDELIMLGRTVIYCGIVPTPTVQYMVCLLYTSPSPRDATLARMPSSA